MVTKEEIRAYQEGYRYLDHIKTSLLGEINKAAVPFQFVFLTEKRNPVLNYPPRLEITCNLDPVPSSFPSDKLRKDVEDIAASYHLISSGFGLKRSRSSMVYSSGNRKGRQHSSSYTDRSGFTLKPNYGERDSWGTN